MTREAELELEIARLRRRLRDVCYEVQRSDDMLSCGNREKALVGIRRASIAASMAEQFIPTTPSTSALQDLIEKVERRTIERCADECKVEWNGDADTYEYTEAANDCAGAIRALPTGNLKLEDLK